MYMLLFDCVIFVSCELIGEGKGCVNYKIILLIMQLDKCFLVSSLSYLCLIVGKNLV